MMVFQEDPDESVFSSDGSFETMFSQENDEDDWHIQQTRFPEKRKIVEDGETNRHLSPLAKKFPTM